MNINLKLLIIFLSASSQLVICLNGAQLPTVEYNDFKVESDNQNLQSDNLDDYLDDLINPIEEIEKTGGVDFRKTGCVLEPRRQGVCGACYSFSTMAVLEAVHCLNKKLNPRHVPERLSTQELVDCYVDKNGQKFGCDGGPAIKAIEYYTNLSFAIKDSCYEYTGEEAECKRESIVANQTQQSHCLVKLADKKQTIKTVTINGHRNMVRHLNEYGPFIAQMRISSSFSFYQRGTILKQQPDDELLEGYHGLVIVGYGRENNEEKTPFWIVKNSFGNQWGDDGFGKILRGKNAFQIEYEGIGVFYEKSGWWPWDN